MRFEDFINEFDYEGSVVLLEGKREVSDEDRIHLIALGKLLASNTKHIIFRSGNAAGADELFSAGVVEVDPARLETVIPYSGHRKNKNPGYRTTSVDEIDLANEPDILYQSRSNKKMGSLIDRYAKGEINKYTIKAAYIIRDTIKVTGTRSLSPASFAFFYDDLAMPQSGGTGHTMNMCSNKKIPFMDQRIWMTWNKY